MAGYSHKGHDTIRYDISQNIAIRYDTIRYDTIRSKSATLYVRTACRKRVDRIPLWSLVYFIFFRVLCVLFCFPSEVTIKCIINIPIFLSAHIYRCKIRTTCTFLLVDLENSCNFHSPGGVTVDCDDTVDQRFRLRCRRLRLSAILRSYNCVIVFT